MTVDSGPPSWVQVMRDGRSWMTDDARRSLQGEERARLAALRDSGDAQARSLALILLGVYEATGYGLYAHTSAPTQNTVRVVFTDGSVFTSYADAIAYANALLASTIGWQRTDTD